MAESPFLPEHFARLDEDPDPVFYDMPRKVVHIDDHAIEEVKQFFRDTLPSDGVILDLMSSWRSHWPPDMPKQKLVGLGMNAEEMSENPDLDDFVIHDLNSNPLLPFEEATFDAVVVTVSIQYMTQPVEVFREVHRILKPDGLFVVIYSNRMFPTKAVAIWRGLNDRQHAELIGAYFQQAGNFTAIEALDRTPAASGYTDPVYVVMARKS
ncbi:class I SAM-dependent methyltransferase [Candidatus Entotheonella palauensis]|uniref:class I SAM-dependent methyltransferase n=1 Tax=Candidatus Entotheonella palauensis TaxID=93172 RepID=UPI000B7D43AC|nr:methyltransferase domain-containing protein [Candidatus Entotheonella palauensis]